MSAHTETSHSRAKEVTYSCDRLIANETKNNNVVHAAILAEVPNSSYLGRFRVNPPPL